MEKVEDKENPIEEKDIKQYQVLGDLIYTALSNTKKTPNNAYFSKQLTNAINDFFQKCEGSTIDKGAITAGAFVGVGKLSSITLKTSVFQSSILSICELLNTPNPLGNTLFAQTLTNAIDTLCTTGEFRYSVLGTATQGTSSIPMGGSAKGNFTLLPNDKILLNTQLVELFTKFNAKQNEDIETYYNRLSIGEGVKLFKDTDESFSYKFADILYPILSRGLIATKGEGTLEGSIGNGTLLFKEKEIING